MISDSIFTLSKLHLFLLFYFLLCFIYFLLFYFILHFKMLWDNCSETGPKRLFIDVRNKLALKYSGWEPHRKNVIIIHGFNGTEAKTPMTILRNGIFLFIHFIIKLFIFIFLIIYH